MATIAPDSTTIDVAEAHDEQSEIHQKLKRAKAAGAAVRARISVTMGLAAARWWSSSSLRLPTPPIR